MAFRENKLIAYLCGSKEELKKVSWPTRQETTRSTINVIIMALGVAAFLGFADYVFNTALQALLTNVQ